MHVLQWVVVEAEDVDTAAETAERLLEQEMGSGDNYSSWYDWFVVGGGRWNVSEDEEDNLMAGYNTKTNMIIAFEDNPNAFRAKIDECIQARVEQYQEYLSEVKQMDIMSKFENYGGVMSYDYQLYPLARLLDYLQGTWNYDSKYYDLVHYSTNATHILSKIDNGLGESLYLVPIDYHF